MVELYLLYALNQGGWGVFDGSSCPDTGAFPPYFYQSYELDTGDWSKVFGRLNEVKDTLVARDLIPNAENTKGIYPTLDELLAEDFEYK